MTPPRPTRPARPAAARTQDRTRDEPRAGSRTTDELRHAALGGLRWTSLGRAAAELSLLGSMVVLARLIPPAEFGPYAVAVVAQELVLGIQSQGIGNALVQRPAAGREHRQAGFALVLIGAAALALVVLAGSRLVAEPVFGTPTATLVALTAPYSVVLGLGIVPTATLRRRLAFRRLAVIDIAGTALRVGGSIALAAAGWGAKSLILGTLAGAAVATAAAWLSAPPPPPRLRRAPARDLLGFGAPASLAAISWTCFRNCDYAIIGARLGTLQAGLYFRAYQLAVEYQKKVSDLMTTVAFPVLARASNTEDLAALRGQVVRLLTMLLFPLLTLLAIVAPELIPWLLGNPWRATVVPTQILALGGAATLVIDTTGVALAAGGRARAMLGFGVAHFAVYAAAVWVVAGHGIAAVATAAAVVHTAFMLAGYALMLSRSGSNVLRELVSDVAPATVASLALAALAVPASIALSGAATPVLAQMAVVGAGGLATYLVALRVAFPIAWRELTTCVRRLLPSRGPALRARVPSTAQAR